MFVLALLVNVGLFVVGAIFSWWITMLCSVGTSLFVLLVILFSNRGKRYSTAGILITFIFPLLGLTIYFYTRENRGTAHARKVWQNINFRSSSVMQPSQQVIDELQEHNAYQGKLSNYILSATNMPVYNNTSTKFISDGEAYFDCMLEEIRKAEKYIFIESYIIEQGNLWNQLFGALKIKARQGVDVRILYDDFGGTNRFEDSNTFKKLENYCIHAAPFNEIKLFGSHFVNLRNKRKMIVVDGKVGFATALNIGDVFVSYKQVYGSWKDTGVMISGDAVWSMAVQFINDWQFATKQEMDLASYKALTVVKRKTQEWVQPFGTDPFNSDSVARNTLINLISCAKKSIYITCPLFILDAELLNLLKVSSRSGIDIRIVFPGIPVNKYSQLIAYDSFMELIKAGVKLYEFTPGFIHEKSIVVDGETALLGNINLDFRKTRTHFENGLLIFGGQTVTDVRFDFERTLNSCHMLTTKDMRARKWTHKISSKILRFFAPIE